MPKKSTNITAVHHRVAPAERWHANGHKGGVLWFTGLSGAGKTTLALETEKRLFDRGWRAYVLDGDNIRHGLSADLGFSPEDREENIRRIGQVAALFAEAGLIVISAFISPYRKDRRVAREAAGEAFHEIFVDADLAVCESRDPKGLYEKARQGDIPDFTGISAPYEVPERAELVVDTDRLDIGESVDLLEDYAVKVFGL